MSRITQILPNLIGGGAERVAVNLANYWAQQGHTVNFALMKPKGEFLDEVAPNIEIFDLGCDRIRQIPRNLRKYLIERQPDVILAHMWPLTSIAWLAWLLAGKPGKLFLCEHIGMSDHVERDLKIPRTLARALVATSHRGATGVIAVSEGASKDLAEFGGLSKQRVLTIHNPVAAPRMASLTGRATSQSVERATDRKFRTSIVSVGTLKPQKNHSLLLKAMALVANELDASLVILGEGAERHALERQIRELGLQDRVTLPGFQSDPRPWLESADLFVLASDYEGFANVIVEALACGVPVVSTDCRYGPAEILSNGQYGVLVPVGNAERLAEGMRKAASGRWDADTLRNRAQDFAIPKQGDVYLKAFGL